MGQKKKAARREGDKGGGELRDRREVHEVTELKDGYGLMTNIFAST